jgi:hypothetical protein
MTNKLSEAIGNDLTVKMFNKGVSDYKIHTTLKICSAPTLEKIKKGKNTKNIPLSVILKIYEAINEKNINIEENGFKLIIKAF